jgi:hypothetical protein
LCTDLAEIRLLSNVLSIFFLILHLSETDTCCKFVLFHDTWSQSLTTLSESQYLYQENYHSMVQCAALNCTVKSGHGISTYLFPQIEQVILIYILWKSLYLTFNGKSVQKLTVPMNNVIIIKTNVLLPLA